MAYSGIYIAFDGLTREDASPWSSTAVLSDLEKKTINKNIYELLSITKNDLNDDGEVCINDAEELVDLVIKEYNKDCKKKYGSDSNVAIQKFSQFIAKVEYDKASPEILNFCFLPLYFLLKTNSICAPSSKFFLLIFLVKKFS